VAASYFSDGMARRQRLVWAVATRQQLARWEPLVAEFVAASFKRAAQVPEPDIWRAEYEHHFALVAARNLIRALDLRPIPGLHLDPVLRAEVIDGRDLHEHWDENMGVFNVTPRVETPPRRSGRDFADRNPERSPYWWYGWGNKTGALLLPNVTAFAVHELLDRVEEHEVAEDPSLAGFVPQRAPSPWIFENGEWWPKPDAPT
jgi:hypothetical protein